MVAYADTSFLVSLYAQDTNSQLAQSLASASKVPFVWTPLHRLEGKNAVRLALFRKDITPEQADAVLVTIEADTAVGVLAETAIPWLEAYDLAETLSASHTRTLGTRAMDILHVAAACVVGADKFYTFDHRQAQLASTAGLAVRPSA